MGVHGIKGEIKVLPYGDLEGLKWETLYIAGKDRAYRLTRVRKHKAVFIVEIEGFSRREDVEPLTGLEVSAPREDLPGLQEDEYYYSDLIGMEVASDDGRVLGRVINIISTGSNDVLEVKGPFGDVLIPAIEEAIVEVDVEKKKVIVRLLEGLLPGDNEV